MAYSFSLFDEYEIFIYLLYQNIYKFLFVTSNTVNGFFFVLIILLGFFTVLTPCFISMLPLLFAYISSNEENKLNNYLFILGIINSIFFILFLSNFINLYSLYNKLPIISSLILILISLNLMQIINFRFVPNFIYQNFVLLDEQSKKIQSYLIGLISGISSLPCNTSIILLIIFLLKQLDSRLLFLLYLFFYFLGCFIPLFFIVNIKISYNNFIWLFLFWEFIFPISGSFLLFFSLLSFLRSSFL
uniref:Thiol:disulfide interchange protein n=1 Tax=Chondria tumulosa TaxID=2740715 RepID=A0A896SQC1_9FLOR|nr:thiol:disulfide interchange protein [Chondria tumulosa]QSD57036.1 thiol:disulfide interchange protein [Chondria tumulosa]